MFALYEQDSDTVCDGDDVDGVDGDDGPGRLLGDLSEILIMACQTATGVHSQTDLREALVHTLTTLATH